MNKENFIHYKTGIETLDKDHWMLFEILDAVSALYKANNKPAGDELYIKSFIPFAEKHFAYEEKLMETSEFPYVRPHSNYHNAIMEKAKRLDMSRATEYNITMLSQVIQSHIDEQDMQYTEYVKKLFEDN